MVLETIFILLIIYFAKYFFDIYKTKTRLSKLTKLIAKIETFYSKKVEFSESLLTKIFENQMEINILLPEPIIFHTNSDIDNFKSFQRSYLVLLDLRSIETVQLKSDKNIFRSFKISFQMTLLFPAIILESIGKTLAPITAKVISVVVWLMIFIINLFGTEIHDWITSLFH